LVPRGLYYFNNTNPADMAREQDYILKLDADTSKLDAAVNSSGQKIDQFGNRAKGSLELIDTASGGATSKLTGLASSFIAAKNGAKSLNIGLQGTKAALAATGIGLFVVALGEVIANWDTITNFFKDKTIENSLSKEVNLLSEIKRKQSDNLQIAQAEGKSVEEINELRATSLVTTSDLLEKEILLAKEQGDEETLLAKQEELRQNQLDITILQVTEETKLKNLLEESAELLDPNLAAANERAELVAKEEEALRKINREIAGITQFSETYKQNAEAAAEGSKDQQYWLDLIAKDQEKLNELLPQQELLQDAINKKLEDYDQKKRDSQNKGKEILEEEKLDVDQYFDDLLDAEEDYFADSMDFALDDFRKEQELEEQRRANFQASHDESMRLLDEAQAKKDEALQADEDAERRRQELISMTNDMRLRLASQSFQAIEALGKAFASQDEKDAERSFKVQKALSLASATVSATEGVVNAYKTAQGSPITLLNPAYPVIQAVLAGAFGVAQVATIARSKFKAPAKVQPPPGGGGGGGSAPTPTTPQLDLGFLGGGAGQTGFRTYVVSSEVTNSQQANQRINDQASLVG
jgi:hypothetical protein